MSIGKSWRRRRAIKNKANWVIALSSGAGCGRMEVENKYLNLKAKFMNYPILSKQKSVSVPAVFLKRFYGLTKTFSILSEEMEDFFLSFDKKKINQLKRARKEHLQKKAKPLSALL